MAQEYKKRPWSHEERNILKKYYGEIELDALLELLPGRTAKSVYNQVHYLRKRRWTFSRKSNE